MEPLCRNPFSNPRTFNSDSGVFKSIAHHAKFRVRALAGGDKKMDTKRTLNSPVDILVANPGRLLSVIKSGELEFSNWKYLICDEPISFLIWDFLVILLIFGRRLRKRNFNSLSDGDCPDDLELRIAKLLKGLSFPLSSGDRGDLKKKLKPLVFLNSGDKVPMLTSFLKEKGRGSGIVFVNRKEDIAEIEEKLQDKESQRRFTPFMVVWISKRRKTFETSRKSMGF